MSDWKREKAERYALRVEVNGRLVAKHLPFDYHGKDGTYVNHGCRCEDCTREHAMCERERNERKRMRKRILEYQRSQDRGGRA